MTISVSPTDRRVPATATDTDGGDPRVQRTRAAALAAAQELLDEGGWGAITHVAVAQRSGIGRTTLYRHWPTADLLLRELITDCCPAFDYVSSGDLRGDLVHLLDLFRSRLLDPSVERAIATVIERASVDPAFVRLRAAITGYYTSTIVATLRQAVDDGSLREDLDIDLAVDELAGPVAFRHLFARRRMTTAFVTQVVEDFLAAHRREG